MEAYIGTILAWPISWAPMDWAICDGSIMQVRAYTPLFSLIGNRFGGDGVNTFALPDLRGRVAVGMGQRPGTAMYNLAGFGGAEAVTLTVDQLPNHAHTSAGLPASTLAGDATIAPAPDVVPARIPDQRSTFMPQYNKDPNPTSLKPGGPTGSTGGNLAHPNMQPYVVLNYIICLNGLYPPRS